MIPFLDLKSINSQYRAELIEACTRVIDSGWYIGGNELAQFEKNFAKYCGVKFAIGVANGLDALILTLRAWKELGKLNDGDEVVSLALVDKSELPEDDDDDAPIAPETGDVATTTE